MIAIVRPICVATVCLLVAGCQTASLEDAVPKSAVVAPADDDASLVTASQPAAGPASDQVSAEGNRPSNVTRRNPGIASIVPLEQTAPVENKAFVASGASRTGQYPTFGRQPKAANTQFSDQEKLAAEAEMTALLKSRASTPDARAQYEARLKRLRALAASHGDAMQQEIEK